MDSIPRTSKHASAGLWMRLPNVQLTELDEGRLRLRALNAGVTREAVEQAIYAAAPETEGIEIEGLAPAEPSFVPLEALLQG